MSWNVSWTITIGKADNIIKELKDPVIYSTRETQSHRWTEKVDLLFLYNSGDKMSTSPLIFGITF